MIGLMIAGVIGIFAGIMLMIMGSVVLGVIVLIAGIVIFVTGTSKMLRAQGYRGEGAYYGGLNGNGRQQSELVENPQPNAGEQSANIWDKVEKK